MNERKELTEKEARHIAELGALYLSDEEVTKFRVQLGSILEFVSRLNEVDTSAVKPLSQTTGLVDVYRDDEVKPGLTQEEALQNAPDAYQGFFKVKAVFSE